MLILNKKLIRSNKVAARITKSMSISQQTTNGPFSSEFRKENVCIKSFAKSTANSILPEMNQAIVLNLLDGTKQIQYIIALNQIINKASNISHTKIFNIHELCKQTGTNAVDLQKLIEQIRS